MSRLRLNFFLAIIIILGATVIGRLFFLQVLKHDFYLAMAKGQQKFFSQILGQRGQISFQGGEKLATNQIEKFVYIAPNEMSRPSGASEMSRPSGASEIQDKEKANQILSQILDLKEDFLKEKLDKNSFYELLKVKINEEELERIKRLGLGGVYIGEKTTRSFPQEKILSQTIGFVDSDGQGQYGLEGFYQKILEGKQGMIEGEKGRKGFLISLLPNEKAKEGNDLILTIDYQIQFEAEKLIEKAQKDLEFESATIIVMDPGSGEILALANWPNFDPNNYGKEENIALFQNSAIQKIFEPGSVFKPIIMASAIQEGRVSPQTTYIDDGVVKIKGYAVYNYDNRVWGKRTMTEVLEKSINTGAVFAQQQLGNELFLKYLEKFGFFEKTNIDLQGEVFSQNQEFKKGYDINFATASFGQGIEITPIQLIKAFSAIANNGRMVKPFLVKKIIDKDGGQKEILPEFSSRVISENTSSQVVSMMTSVIENGYGKKAKIPGYFIAGKTGTAQVAWSALGVAKKGYSDKTVQSFLGFAPAFNPRFMILVKLDNPKAKTAEYSALPIFHDLAKYIVNLWQIPPDYEP